MPVFRPLLVALSVSFASSALAAEKPPVTISGAVTEARKLSDAFVAVAEKVSPSVVQIETTARDDGADELSRLFGIPRHAPMAKGMGSGVLFTQDGAILTNNHVVAEAISIQVRLRDGRALPAKLMGRDPATDLAVIKVEGTGFAAASFANSDGARVGEWVVAIGSPFGLGYTVTAGVLSAKGRGGLGQNAIEDYLQTDASINPGNSGGPLCDLDGKVLGINTMIIGRATGIGFAVPANMAKRVGDQILKTGSVQRPWVGVAVQDLTPELAQALKLEPRSGVLVSSVIDASPAFKANVRAGDVIASFGGKPIKEDFEFLREVNARSIGETVQLEIVRQGQRYAAQVTLGPRPESHSPTQHSSTPAQVQPQGLGFSVRDLSKEQAQAMNLAKPVAMVTQVAPGSVAERAGLRPQDLIVEADGTSDPSAAQVQQAAADGILLLRLRRKDSFYYVALKR